MARDRELEQFLARCRAEGPSALTAVAAHLAGRGGDPAFAPPIEWATPEVLGAVHEAVLEPATRRRRGTHVTPPAVAAAITREALTGLPAPSVCDHAVGGGAFLLAAARVMLDQGLAPAEVAGRLFGSDIDPGAIDVARAAL